jgi:hypothetical protein
VGCVGGFVSRFPARLEAGLELRGVLLVTHSPDLSQVMLRALNRSRG